MSKSNSAIAPSSNSGPGPQNLAREMLGRLRQRSADKLRLYADSAEELDVAAQEGCADVRVPADKASYAVRLAYCLAEKYPAMTDLADTRVFIVIVTPACEDELAVGGVLAELLTARGSRVSHNPPSFNLRDEDRYVVLAEVAGWHSRGWPQTVAEAAARRLPVFCVLARGAKVPDAMVGADLTLALPPMTSEMLGLIFEAAHDEVPAGVEQFKLAEKIGVADLAAYIRRGRSAEDCLAGLQAAVISRELIPTTNMVMLKDLAGYGEAKDWGQELAEDMDLWRNGVLKWDDVDHRAAVLSGPPGTGKTSFAKVLANTLRVPLIATSVAEWNGRSHLSGTIKRMEEVFGQALAQAPCVLFVDELDGIANRNTLDDRYVEYWTQIINRMLELVTEALGKEGVILVGATNHVDRIDPALLRSGRLDQVIRIGLPDAEAIVDILSRYVGGGIAKSDLASLAPQLVGRSGADIEKLVRDARAAARRAGRPFSVEELQSQLPDPMKGLSPQTRRRISVYRKGQRLVAQVLGLAELTINEQHHDLRRLLAPGLSGERFPTQQLCDDVLTVIMGGRAAEEIVFGDVSVYGAGAMDSDLAAATAIAREMELKAGFGEVGTVYLGEISDAQALTPTAIASIRRRVEAALARASAVLLDNRDELERGDRLERGNAKSAGVNLRLLN